MKEGKGVSVYISKIQLNTNYAMILTRWMKVSNICGSSGNSCNKSYLVVTLYQPSSNEKEKLIWIEKLDTLLSIINSTWNKTIIITGDTNIDYLKTSVALKRYKEVIETYNLKQCITIPTRKGTKINDHIITNLQENKLITTNALPCPTVSDHDASYIVLTNNHETKFQTRAK